MAGQGKTGRKIGRNSDKCQRYLSARKRIKNKTRKITKWYNHIVKNRQPKNAKGKDKKPLRPLKIFIDKIGRKREKQYESNK